MAPRSRCLNVSSQILKKTSASRATFSTSQVRPADDPPRSRAPSPADLIASLGDDVVPSSRLPHRDPFKPIQLPVRNARLQGSTNAATGGAAASRVARILQNSRSREERRQEATREPGQKMLSSADEMAKHKMGQDLSKQITRRWKAGDVYAPHDLSSVEMAKWKNRGRPTHDVFDVLDFKPAEHYRNFSIMSEYMTPMGRIKHSNETGLRPVNQRRIARAIRRSIGMGMMPSVHRHPEILQKVLERNEQISPFRSGSM